MKVRSMYLLSPVQTNIKFLSGTIESKNYDLEFKQGMVRVRHPDFPDNCHIGIPLSNLSYVVFESEQAPPPSKAKPTGKQRLDSLPDKN